MIRTLTVLAMISTAGSGLYLYSEKHRAAQLDHEIAVTIRKAEVARARAGMLTTEWATLSGPDQLTPLADKYLTLKPLQPNQYVSLNDLGNRLPPMMTEAEANPKDTTDDDTPPPDAAVANDAAPVAPPADPGVMPAPPAPPAVVAAKADAPKPAAKPQVKLAGKAAPKKPAHPVAVADRDPPLHDTPLAHGTMLPLASPQPMRPQVMQAMAHPTQYGARQAVVSAVPHFLSQAPYTGSNLVHQGALPPPVPYAAGAQ
jgi:hypothetical protein